MKRVYESPKMTAEVYSTSAYCGNCQDHPQYELTGTLSVAPSSWKSTQKGSGWQGNNVYNEAGVTHTFTQASGVDFQAQDANGNSYTNTYWKCTDEDGWYLEKSGYYDDFILYKESTGNSSLDIGWGSTFPRKAADGCDTAVAWVSFTNVTKQVPNS